MFLKFSVSISFHEVHCQVMSYGTVDIQHMKWEFDMDPDAGYQKSQKILLLLIGRKERNHAALFWRT